MSTVAEYENVKISFMEYLKFLLLLHLPFSKDKLF